MGLDGIELVMNVEDGFGISIPDADAERLQTVGQLYQYVRDRLGGRPISPCASASAFYRVRTALVDAGVALRGEVRPATDLAVTFDAAPEAWAFFLAALGLRPVRPPLRADLARPLRTAATLSAAVATVAWVLLLIVRSHPLPVAFVAIGSLLGLIFTGAALAGRLPDRCRTVGGFVHHHEAALTPLRDEAIWKRVVEIVAHQCGVKADEITPDLDFVRDLLLG